MLKRSAGKGFEARLSEVRPFLSGTVSSSVAPATVRRSANDGICGQPSESFVRFRLEMNVETFLRTCGTSKVSVVKLLSPWSITRS